MNEYMSTRQSLPSITNFPDNNNKFRNLDHPELQDGEVWYTNTSVKNYDLIKFKSKRLGVQAYDCECVPISKETKPVFVSKKEYQEYIQKQIDNSKNKNI
jgi:hypothetical protein